MKVLFTTTDTPFQAGTEYDLPASEAKKFVRHGVAELVEKASKGTSKPTPKKTTSRKR